MPSLRSFENYGEWDVQHLLLLLLLVLIVVSALKRVLRAWSGSPEPGGHMHILRRIEAHEKECKEAQDKAAQELTEIKVDIGEIRVIVTTISDSVARLSGRVDEINTRVWRMRRKK